ncbi:hypothetical protein [Costertonia aggregata]|uniref:Lipocalin family protein n=1 Tax=Costertonia aggregata TaxID=343403 RepID=A0A7H9AP28_9FLAO|nr:hypothetical protein [Costertonia aggregata]QLG45186.1 hypothetical protein HYG79_07430 [Costertonia aggregata]
MNKKSVRKLLSLPVLFSFVVFTSCSKDSDVSADETSETEEIEQTDNETSSCDNATNYVFIEKDGLVKVEFENAEFSGDWKLKKDGNSFSGEGYMVWEGSQYLNAPGNSIASYTIKIQNPGTYRFLWSSAIKNGNNGTEHNDTWLRFNDAADFYGLKGTDSYVYPKDTGKTPNPNGSSKEGWFKVYRSGNNLDFIWMSRTSDNDAHDIYVEFDTAGAYVMEISPRSSNHGIDQFVLFKDTVAKDVAISTETAFSNIICD